MFRKLVSRSQKGFTLIEMALVMLVIGIVTAGLIPSLQDLHHKSMRDEDKRILTNLREVLIGQFLATGRLPTCMTAAGGASTTGNCDTARSLGSFAVRVRDSRGTDIKYDVRNELSGYASISAACAGLNSILSAGPAAGPFVCHEAPDYDNAATWGSYCSTQDGVAFVLVGTGLNRNGQSGEVAASTGSVLGNRSIGGDRVFENTSRRHDVTWHYDDLVEVVTLQQLRAAIPSTSCP